MAAPLAGTMQCARHPVPAVDVCQRCGAFTCPECLELTKSGPLCTACHRRQGGGEGPGRAARAAKVLGWLSVGLLALMVLLGLAARLL